ncbi:ligase-associated DNA damage response endonuclease PdeM [Candidatus Protochlamydia sp. W-9]|uniref:ligase-associated DNA damage response endonuclease PdeM n=1 Tax=Candidatus Protochlamydia sp. W-9 TaxID=1785087 RepID=UPI00096A906C|nr:ligase-associated DNA damage response endonuclease PdeM [Candidatus Protochlamydia sp. W-9]
MKCLIENQTCHFLPQRGVYWEEQKTLIIADVHLGKATTFRKAGILIPDGSMEADLRQLNLLIQNLQPDRCIVVGDLIHATSGLSEYVQNTFTDWLKMLPCDLHLVMGNHDKNLVKYLPKTWSFHIHANHFLMEPFYFCHIPCLQEPWFVWSGHLHPKIELKSRHDRLSLHCFQIFPKLGILPAFSEFVGGSFVKKDSNCNIFGIVDSSVIKL